MEKYEQELKAKLRLDINIGLIMIAFTVFALVISLNPSLLKESFLVPIQLTVAIPLLLSATFASSKLAYTRKPKIWEEYGFLTFLVGYSFLVNIIGILLSLSVGIVYGITFLIFNIIVALMYSALEVAEKKSKLISRIKKDALFAILLLLGGILPSLGIY